MSGALEAFDLPRVKERLARFLGQQGLEDVEVEDLGRFTFGFRGRRIESATKIDRTLTPRLGPRRIHHWMRFTLLSRIAEGFTRFTWDELHGFGMIQ